MSKDFLRTGGEIDPAFAESADAKLGPVAWNTVRTFPDTIKARDDAKALDRAAAFALHLLFRGEGDREGDIGVQT